MLYPYQEKSVEFHLAHHYSVNACEPGLGKTRIALSAAMRANENILVIGPKFLQTSWQMEASVMGCNIRFIPYSMLHKTKLKDVESFGFWVADECHFLKSATAIRTGAFYALLKSVKPNYFLGLTGTPIRNRVPDLWTLIGFCGVNPLSTSGKTLIHPLNKYHGFCRYFCNMEEVFIGRGRKATKYTTLRSDREEEFKSYLKDKMIRFRVEDVLQDLPELTRNIVSMPLKGLPDSLKEDFDAYMSGRKTTPTGKASSALLKSSLTAEFCQSFSEVGQSALIFTDHVESAKKIAEILKCPAVTGQTPAGKRSEIVEEFQKGLHKFLVATIGALSVGVTLTAARHVVFNDLSWVPSDNLQAEKRIHRIGQKNACFSHYIVSSPTDDYIQKTLVSKLETIKKVIG